MQPASDLFLGWVTAELSGKQFYVRQLRDAKIKPLVETFDAELLLSYARPAAGCWRAPMPSPETLPASAAIWDRTTGSMRPWGISR